MSSKPKFSNRPNQCVRTESGNEIWVSRAMVVMAEVFMYSETRKEWYVLLGKRGEGVPNYQGYWGFACGFLDWDEKLYEGALREAWEETGLYIPGLLESKELVASYGIVDHTQDKLPQPWMIMDSYDAAQNISIHFGCLFRWRGERFPELSIENAEKNEAADAAWISVAEAMKMQLAFEHSQRLAVIWETEKAVFDQLACSE